MARISYLWRDGEWVPARLAKPLHTRHGRAPMIRTDGMEPVRSMLDGKMYDSRSRYYGTLKANGCEIVGDDRAPFDRVAEFNPTGIDQDISRAIDELSST